MTDQPIYLIVAVDKNFGMGKKGQLPWRLKKEMAYFRETTLKTKDPSKKNMVIMGRTTWESIPENHRPLADRANVVLTRQPDFKAPGAKMAPSLDEAYDLADDSIETIYVIGGAQVFAEAMQRNDTTGLYLTVIDHAYDCDTALPDIPGTFTEITSLGEDEENGIPFEYLLYERS